MNKKIKYLVIFLAMGVGALTILFIRPSKAFLYQNAIGDCAGRTTFMYNALYSDTSNADIALFGSSRTMNDINDSLMTALGKERFLNLGYCRFGRNMDYFFIEEYCNLHHPKKIVLEVREEEGNSVHPLTAFLLPVSKITEDAYSFKVDVFQHLYNKWLCNLKFARGKLFDDLPEEPGKVSTNHGFWYGDKVTDIKPLIKKRFADSIEYHKAGRGEETLNRYSEYYFNKLRILCQKNKIELYFLYLPSYGNINGQPLQAKYYHAYGKLLIPPDSIVKNVLNFSDYGHLNKRGADLISLWLAASTD